MNRKDARHCKGQAPHDATETDNDQSSIDKGRKQYLPELSGKISLQNIANRMEFGIVRISNEV